jgi:hypothetical protein
MEYHRESDCRGSGMAKTISPIAACPPWFELNRNLTSFSLHHHLSFTSPVFPLCQSLPSSSCAIAQSVISRYLQYELPRPKEICLLAREFSPAHVHPISSVAELTSMSRFRRVLNYKQEVSTLLNLLVSLTETDTPPRGVCACEYSDGNVCVH